jgi:TatD DNase family protein
MIHWYDSHCHVSSSKFDNDRQEVLQRARASHISLMVDIGCEIPSWPRALKLAAEEADVHCALGLHPHEARHWDEGSSKALKELLQSSEKVAAIGEMGLDYYYKHSHPDKQVEVFHAQLDMARELELPAVFHIRDAHEQAAGILAAHPEVKGIVHCFTGNAREAERYLDLGHAISFSGIVTFKTAADIQEAAQLVPLDKILVETDSPYLSPVPKRGRRNEPANVAHTGRFIAKLRGMDEVELARITRRNTERLLRISRAQGQ